MPHQIAAGARRSGAACFADDRRRESCWPSGPCRQRLHPRHPGGWCCGAPGPAWSTTRARCWLGEVRASDRQPKGGALQPQRRFEVLRAHWLIRRGGHAEAGRRGIARTFQFIGHRQYRAGIRGAVAGRGTGQTGRGLALAGADAPAGLRDPPGRRAVEGGRGQPGSPCLAGLPQTTRPGTSSGPAATGPNPMSPPDDWIAVRLTAAGRADTVLLRCWPGTPVAWWLARTRRPPWWPRWWPCRWCCRHRCWASTCCC